MIRTKHTRTTMRSILFISLLALGAGCAQRQQSAAPQPEAASPKPVQAATDTVPCRPNAEFLSPLTGNVSPTGKSGLTLSVAQPTFRIDSTEWVETILRNEGDDTLTVGQPYYLERFRDGKWMRIDLSHDAEGRVIVFDAIGYYIHPGEELRLKRGLWKSVYRYTPGRYRVVVPHPARPGQEEPEWLAAEFRLE